VVQFAFAAALGELWFPFLGWFLLGAAQAEESQSLLRGALKDAKVEDIMSSDPVAVPESTTVESFIDEYAMRHRFSTLPVKNESEDVVGIVTIGRIKQVPREDRSKMNIRPVARPLEEVGVAVPDESAVTVLERMQGCSDGRALALEGNRLLGIVSPRDIQRALELAGMRGQPLSRSLLRT
jgi:CBS domain-containing protein